MPTEFFSPSVKKPWYKTVKGIILMIFLSLLILAILGFTFLFFYYAWQIKYGDAPKFAEQFNTEKISKSSFLVGNGDSISAEEMNKYIRPFNSFFGEKDAKLTILMFIDFECPFCREAHPVFKQVMEKYSPVVKVVFKNIPLVDIHPESGNAALAASCVGEQGKFWQYYDRLLTDQKLDAKGLENSAEIIGVDLAKFNVCLEQNKYETQIEIDMQDAVDLGVRGTPTYFVNGIKVEGVLGMEDWDKIILQSLNN